MCVKIKKKILSFYFKKSQAAIIWQPENWAFGCDFVNRDLTNVKVKGEECGPTCVRTPDCTHFAWTDYEQGTCWMKYGSVSKSDAIESNNPSIVCGIVEKSPSQNSKIK